MLFYRRTDCLPGDAIQPTVPRALARLVERDNEALVEEQQRSRARTRTVGRQQLRRDHRDRGDRGGPGLGFGGGFGPSFVQ